MALTFDHRQVKHTILSRITAIIFTQSRGQIQPKKYLNRHFLFSRTLPLSLVGSVCRWEMLSFLHSDKQSNLAMNTQTYIKNRKVIQNLKCIFLPNWMWLNERTNNHWQVHNQNHWFRKLKIDVCIVTQYAVHSMQNKWSNHHKQSLRTELKDWSLELLFNYKHTNQF